MERRGKRGKWLTNELGPNRSRGSTLRSPTSCVPPLKIDEPNKKQKYCSKLNVAVVVVVVAVVVVAVAFVSY